MLKFKKILPLILILLLAGVLRFYKLPEMANYDFDQEYAANFAYATIKEFPIQLIGQGLSIDGLFMGPWYFYYLVPFFALTNLHPIGGFIGSVFLGLAIITTYFIVANNMFGYWAGILSAVLRTFIFTGLNTDWSMVPSYSSELLVLISWYCFYQYFRGNLNFLPLLGLSFGLYTSIHPILFPFYLVFFVIFIIKRSLPNIKIASITAISFIIPLSPLIIFEYLHNFLEVKRLFSLFLGPPSGSGGLNRLANHLQIVISEPYRIFSIDLISKDLFLVIFFGITLLLLIKKVGFWKDHFHKIALSITFLVFLFYYTLFPTHVPEYYFLGLTTLILLYTSANLSLLASKPRLLVILILILTVIALTNFRHLISRWNNPSLITLYYKDAIVKEILKRQKRDVESYVSYIKLPGWNFGFDYLFKYYGQVPQTKEAKPPIYTIVIPKYLSEESLDIQSGNIGLILPK